MKLQKSTAVAETILVKMEEHAQKYVSPRPFGTIVLVQQILWVDTVNLKEKAAGERKSGLYTVIDDRNQSFQVFCDFDSEPGFAWNLIQSFSLSQKQVNCKIH